MGTSDSLIIPLVWQDMLGPPMFVRNPLHTRHSILPRGTLHVLSVVASVQVAGFIFLGILTIPDLRIEA